MPAPDDRLIDLHVHTTASDGTLAPGECVALAARLGLAAIAITDHDTVAGNAPALARGAELGFEVVPGVEISTSYQGVAIHLLGYYPAAEAAGLEALLAEVREGRRERNPRILGKLAELGCPVDAEEVAQEAGGEVVGRPHIAAVMIRRGYVASLQEAFDRYLARGAPAYVERRKASPAEAIATLRGAGAVPVLAHPAASGFRDPRQAEPMVGAFVDLGLRGIEAHYTGHTQADVALYSRLARTYGLVVTGGSDFHGETKPEIQMGRGLGSMRVPAHLLSLLKHEHRRLAAG